MGAFDRSRAADASAAGGGGDLVRGAAHDVPGVLPLRVYAAAERARQTGGGALDSSRRSTCDRASDARPLPLRVGLDLGEALDGRDLLVGELDDERRMHDREAARHRLDLDRLIRELHEGPDGQAEFSDVSDVVGDGLCAGALYVLVLGDDELGADGYQTLPGPPSTGFWSLAPLFILQRECDGCPFARSSASSG